MSKKIYFYKTLDPYGFLGNFYKSKFYIYGNWWNHVEGPYQAMKCVNKEDFEKLVQAKKGKEARDLGQKVKMISNWDKIKVEIMTECVMAKFLQNRNLLDQLIETGDAELIEDSPVDSFWGCGKDRSGQNHLGKVLMAVREQLSKNY